MNLDAADPVKFYVNLDPDTTEEELVCKASKFRLVLSRNIHMFVYGRSMYAEATPIDKYGKRVLPTCFEHFGVKYPCQTTCREFTARSILCGKKIPMKDFEGWRDPEYCLFAIKERAHSLTFIENQTHEMILEAVNRSGDALPYAKFQTPEICMAAVLEEPCALQYVKNQTPEICMAAVSGRGYALRYVREQTPEICMIAVEENPYALRWVKQKTAKICETAIAKNENVRVYA